MNDTNTNQQAPRTLAEAQSRAMPPVAAPPPTAAATPVAAPLPSGTPTNPLANKNVVMIIGGLLVIGILIFAFLYMRSAMPPKEEAPVAITPTTLLSPTPPPNLSRLSTTSAFLSYTEEVASFSAILSAFSLQDATLVPPILDIELDLKN